MRKRVDENQLGLFEPAEAKVIPIAPRLVEPPRSEPKTPEPKTPEPKTPEPKTPEPKTRPVGTSSPSLTDTLRLEQNLALMAGAGTGKTHSLITLCLHLLGGARQGPPVAPHGLGLFTFTDKAAAEMRQRLYTRLDALARGTATEPELTASFEALGKEPPSPATWRGIRDGLGGAPIGTFHSLCVQLLRVAPPGRAFSPSFELLDDRDAASLLIDTADRVTLQAIEKGSAPISDLAREWSVTGNLGVTHGLLSVLRRMREEGQTANSIAIGDEPIARAELAAALEHAHAELARSEAETQRKIRPEDTERMVEIRRALTGFDVDTAGDRYGAIDAALAGTRTFSDLRKAVAHLGGAVAGIRMLPHERAFRVLLGDLATAYARALKDRNALDFTALLCEARDLLRDDLDARRLAQARFHALLVDELQDTNRLQLELIHLLAERRDGAPRPTNPPLLGAEHSVTALPLEPAFLCVVGDRKQSIYEFRGADVSVVEQAARAIDESGGSRAFLKTSRRSSPALVSFFNRVFPRLMLDPRTQRLAAIEPTEGELPRAGARSFEVSYVPAHDDLTAHRAQLGTEPAVERFVNPPSKPSADELRFIDARALARRVRQLVESKAHRGADIAFLFRRFSFVEEYRQALLAEGVPHRVVRGRGFYGAQEVMDLAAALALVADPSDATSLVVALRSPLVGFTDASLVRLARATGGRLDARKAISLAEVPANLSELERVRLDAFQRLIRGLRAERHRLGLRAMLREVLSQTRYLEAMAATAFGPQILANVEKLLELAAREDARGPADCGAFARELSLLADSDPLEAHADVIDEDDPDAVTLCTIHQAKGLEWPVVVLPELFSSGGNFGMRARYERDLGLALKPYDVDLGEEASPRFERAKRERKAREDADFKRLRYVAMTRARDRLILGVTRKGAAWADLDAACAGAPEVLEHPLQLPELLPPLQRRAAASDLRALEEAQARLAARPAPKPKRAMLPVTQLQDFALCPTRYRLLHLVGLSEYPTEPRALELDVAAAVADVRERGTHAHKLLEKVPLGVDEIDLAALARAEGLPEDPEVRGWVARFLATPFARGLKDVHRELPFVLRLQHGDFTLHLRGAIDLLVRDADGGATVVDYKSSLRPKDGLDAYRFQLGCYVLAARALLGDVPIRAGIAFLREADASPELLPPGAAVDEAWLASQAHALVTAQIDGRWQAQTEPRCRALKCGYVYRCHPTGGLL